MYFIYKKKCLTKADVLIKKNGQFCNDPVYIIIEEQFFQFGFFFQKGQNRKTSYDAIFSRDAVLEFEMGNQPNKEWGSSDDALPPSMVDETF